MNKLEKFRNHLKMASEILLSMTISEIKQWSEIIKDDFFKIRGNISDMEPLIENKLENAVYLSRASGRDFSEISKELGLSNKETRKLFQRAKYKADSKLWLKNIPESYFNEGEKE